VKVQANQMHKPHGNETIHEHKCYLVFQHLLEYWRTAADYLISSVCVT